ncbi:MAG: MurT ligase domain-containing protein [Bacillota bacterium]|nr:MurT ligase domain-containing protein [Bacillota bacterium]
MLAKLRFYLALYTAKLSLGAIKALARGRGSNLPGTLALKLDPHFLSHLRGVDVERTVFVTGTNGKSTTLNLLARIFATAKREAVVNSAGANLSGGVATTLAAAATLGGDLGGRYLLLEVDERFLPLVHAQLPARHLLVTNIQKDQVQRNGEPDIIYRKIRAAIDEHTTLYLPNDEPLAHSLSRYGRRAVLFGAARNPLSFAKGGDYLVTMPCPLCGHALSFAYYNIDNAGAFSCAHCGFAAAEHSDYTARDIDFERGSFTVNGDEYRFHYANPFFLSNYIAALAVAREAGISAADIAAAFDAFTNIEGRIEEVCCGEKTLHYIRMKQENPETLQNAVNQIARDKREKIFILGLDELVDFRPHYTNTFYAFDCDWQALIDSHVCHYICFSSTVCYDAANVLLYAGVPAECITILPTNDDAAVIAELNRHACDNVYLITWLKQYYSLAKYARSHFPAREVSAHV